MSYVIGFAPDAVSQWRALDFDLQERVLDVLEAVALQPPPVLPDDPGIVRDFVRSGTDADDLVFVLVSIDHARRRVILTGANLISRPPKR